ncbi:MAG TPA: hypothetical protein VHN38_03960, partial [Immundisolibacter sp.]|nr:hypothetical protein [Immundisolibacter sp.]
GGAALRALQEGAATGATPGARALQRLLGRPATVGDTASLVREGATLGGPIEFLRKPEGAEQMTPADELAARATQSAVGVAAGAAGDALLGSVLAPMFRQGKARVADLLAARRDARTAAALDKEAGKAGFKSTDEYVDALVEVRTGPDGALIVVPRQEVLSNLPGAEPVAGEVAALPAPAGAPPAAPDRPTPESGETLAAQFDAFVAGRKPGILLTPGESLPDILPPGARTADIPGRGTLVYRDDATLEAARAGRMGEALGYGIDEKPAGGATVVTARDAQGRVVNDVVTDGRPEVTEAARVAAGPQGTIQERTTQAALQERALTRRAERYDALAAGEEDLTMRQELQRLAQIAREQAAGAKPKLTASERARQRRAADFEADDLVTLIQKLGGLNVDSGDWRGYLDPVRNRMPGLPKPEQTGERGMRLDMLSERLWEYGWIPENDLRLVEELLDRARTGEKVYSPMSDSAARERWRIETENERDRELSGQGPDDWSGPDDWVFAMPGASADRSANGFIIRPQDGAVVPARPIDETDLERIIEEERIAAEEAAADAALTKRNEDERFNREFAESQAADQERAAGADAAGVSGRPADAGALGLPQRDGRGPEGRPGDQS